MADETGTAGVLKEVAQGLRPTPAYLLVFGVVAAMTTGAGILGGDNTPVAVLLVVGAIALAGGTIWLVEARAPTVRFESPEQAGRISELKEREEAIHDVLEGLTDASTESYFVYSSSVVDQFLDHEGKVNPYPFRKEEKVVTTIRDAWGIAMVHGLLHLGGKTPDSLKIITAAEFSDTCWDADLILVGSGFANPKTEAALNSFASPLRFSGDRVRIVRDPAKAGEVPAEWPRPDEDGRYDYGLIVKLKSIRNGQERVHLVLAGVGPTGTLGACYHLSQRIVSLHEKFKSSPFGLVVRVDKDMGFTSTEEVEGSARSLEVRT